MFAISKGYPSMFYRLYCTTLPSRPQIQDEELSVLRSVLLQVVIIWQEHNKLSEKCATNDIHPMNGRSF